MSTPVVSFIVPCFKLGHLLRECVETILAQTYRDFELLIMDDCSPDQTGTVATSFGDPRVRYIRNDSNLGHLRNYNKGIDLARSKYVWLISADDRLRVPYVLARYVRYMDEHPDVGYVFCPGIGLYNGVETDILRDAHYGDENRTFDGQEFIKAVIQKTGGLLSPAVMVRRACYEQISRFPLDMPHQGDLYLWLLWALHYRVGYFGEPMVNYRTHDHNMMMFLQRSYPETVFRDEVNVLWRIKREAEHKNYHALADYIEPFICRKYAHAVGVQSYNETCVPWGMSVEECDGAFKRNAESTREYYRLRSRFEVLVGDKHWHHSAFNEARQSYLSAIQRSWLMPAVWAKLGLLCLGSPGNKIRTIATRIWRRPADNAAQPGLV